MNMRTCWHKPRLSGSTDRAVPVLALPDNTPSAAKPNGVQIIAQFDLAAPGMERLRLASAKMGQNLGYKMLAYLKGPTTLYFSLPFFSFLQGIQSFDHTPASLMLPNGHSTEALWAIFGNNGSGQWWWENEELEAEAISGVSKNGVVPQPQIYGFLNRFYMA